MTANQYIKLYDFFKQNFNVDEAKARVFAGEIERIVEEKFEKEKEHFASKSELIELKHEVQMLRQEMKTGFAELESKMRAEFNKIVIWFVSTMFAMIALLYTLLKLFQ